MRQSDLNAVRLILSQPNDLTDLCERLIAPNELPHIRERLIKAIKDNLTDTPHPSINEVIRRYDLPFTYKTIKRWTRIYVKALFEVSSL